MGLFAISSGAPPTDPDRALALQAKAGATAAFETLVRRHQGPLRAFLRRVCVTPDQADDVAQETFLTAWRRIGQYRVEGAFKAWLFQIAWRAALDDRRGATRGARRDTKWALDLDASDSPENAADARLDLNRVLALLPPEQRAVLALCHGAGFSHSEAADALNLPLGTVKSHAARGRDRALALMRAPNQLEVIAG